MKCKDLAQEHRNLGSCFQLDWCGLMVFIWLWLPGRLTDGGERGNQLRGKRWGDYRVLDFIFSYGIPIIVFFCYFSVYRVDNCSVPKPVTPAPALASMWSVLVLLKGFLVPGQKSSCPSPSKHLVLTPPPTPRPPYSLPFLLYTHNHTGMLG